MADEGGFARLGLAGVASWLVVVLVGCGAVGSEDHEIEEPVTIERSAGSLALITLTEDAAGRIGVRTEEVQERRSRLVVSNAALIVDPDGDWWLYTNPQPLVFRRHPVVIAREAGQRAVLRDGPAAGTSVVTVGAAELYGIELEIGH